MNKRILFSIFLVSLLGCTPDFQGGKTYRVGLDSIPETPDSLRLNEQLNSSKVGPVIRDTITTWF